MKNKIPGVVLPETLRLLKPEHSADIGAGYTIYKDKEYASDPYKFTVLYRGKEVGSCTAFSRRDINLLPHLEGIVVRHLLFRVMEGLDALAREG